MEYINSTALWGLLGMLIPTVIFLLSKKKQVLIPFGTLRFLQESESRSAKSIFPSQWLLYFLRLIIVFLLIMLLAKPLFESKVKNHRVVIEKSVYDSPEFSSLNLDFDKEPEIVEPSSLMLLIRTLSVSDDSVTVYSRSLARNFIGDENKLNPKITWKTVPFRKAELVIDTLGFGEYELLTQIQSDENGLSWELAKSPNPSDRTPIHLKIEASTERQQEAMQLRSILSAYEGSLPFKFVYDDTAYNYQILIDTVCGKSQQKEIIWSQFNGPLRINESQPGIFTISGTISKSNLVRSTFAIDLAAVFLSDFFNLDRLDRRIKEPAVMKSEGADLKTSNLKLDRRNIWMIALLTLLFVERWYSKKLAAS